MCNPHLQQIADYVRYLSLLSVERAKSGHPGLPLGCAELGTLLYTGFLRGIGQTPGWINRDRFVLSAGHGSMLLYALEYIFGQQLQLSDLANFRQKHSNTPGHPEMGVGCNVETSTGPLGQGFSNAVGMALEGKILQEKVKDTLDYKVCVLMGDGCIMEGITYESASLAGHWKLDNLIAFYDQNQISIDGDTDITLSEDVAMRFISSGWHVEKISQKSIDTLSKALIKLRSHQECPTLFIVSTVIGSGLNKFAGKSSCHGAPVGLQEIEYCVQNSSIANQFDVSTEPLKNILQNQIATGNFLSKNFLQPHIDSVLDNNKKIFESWQNTRAKIWHTWEQSCPPIGAKKIKQILYQRPPSMDKNRATRDFFHQILQEICSIREDILVGTADLATSTKVFFQNSPLLSRENFSGRNIAFGTREHAMAGICNGLSLGKRFWTISSTFLSFLDYMKSSVRLTALMGARQIYVFSHDSLAVGEDGPTHQPVEQVFCLRSIPKFVTFRPSSEEEVGFSLLYLLENNFPGAIITSRQKLVGLEYSMCIGGSAQDRYEQFCGGKTLVFQSTVETPSCKIIFCSTGSEVGLCMMVAKKLEEQKIHSKVYSISSFELLQKQDPQFFSNNITNSSDIILGVMVEASNWGFASLFFGDKIRVVDVREFGFSAPGEQVLREFGFCEEALVKLVLQWVKK